MFQIEIFYSYVMMDLIFLPIYSILLIICLKNILKEGGIYVIEDIETSYWKRGDLYGYNFNYGYHHKQSVIEVFKAIIDDINDEYLNTDEKKLQKLCLINEDVKSMISTITFCHNCIIIVKKPLCEYSNRKYRFEDRIL